MHKTMLLGALALSVMMVAPSAVAVHGEAYDAYGTAVGPGGAYLVHVAWSGYNWQGGDECGFGCFTVTLHDAAGNIAVQEKFPGGWQASGPVYYCCELLNYQAWALEAGCSQSSCTHFFIRGLQGQQVSGGAPQKAIMVYVGNFWDYQLQLVVPYGTYLPL